LLINEGEIGGVWRVGRDPRCHRIADAHGEKDGTRDGD
jgi:hypothetical protein